MCGEFFGGVTTWRANPEVRHANNHGARSRGVRHALNKKIIGCYQQVRVSFVLSLDRSVHG